MFLQRFSVIFIPMVLVPAKADSPLSCTMWEADDDASSSYSCPVNAASCTVVDVVNDITNDTTITFTEKGGESVEMNKNEGFPKKDEEGLVHASFDSSDGEASARFVFKGSGSSNDVSGDIRIGDRVYEIEFCGSKCDDKAVVMEINGTVADDNSNRNISDTLARSIGSSQNQGPEVDFKTLDRVSFDLSGVFGPGNTSSSGGSDSSSPSDQELDRTPWRYNHQDLLDMGKADSDTMVTYSIIFYYTLRFAQQYVDRLAYANKILDYINESYKNNNLPVRAALHCVEYAPDFVEAPDNAANLDSFMERRDPTPEKPGPDLAFRSADVAIILISGQVERRRCGLTKTNFPLTVSNKRYRSVAWVNTGCRNKGAGETAAHEIGHMFGAAHDRYFLSLTRGRPMFPYAMGFATEHGKYRTILSAFYTSLKLINYYSDSKAKYKAPDGKELPLGDATTADNARVIRENRFWIAGNGNECQKCSRAGYGSGARAKTHPDDPKCLTDYGPWSVCGAPYRCSANKGTQTRVCSVKGGCGGKAIETRECTPPDGTCDCYTDEKDSSGGANGMDQPCIFPWMTTPPTTPGTHSVFKVKGCVTHKGKLACVVNKEFNKWGYCKGKCPNGNPSECRGLRGEWCSDWCDMQAPAGKCHNWYYNFRVPCRDICIQLYKKVTVT